MQQRPWGSYFLLFAGMALAGTYIALSKPLVATIPLFVLALLRFGIAAIILLPWTRGPALDRATWKTLWVQSFFGNFLFSICMLTGVALSSAMAAGLVMSVLPAMVAVFSVIFLKEKISRRAAVAVVISIVGILVLQWATYAQTGQEMANGVDASNAQSSLNSGFGDSFSSLSFLQQKFLGNVLLLAAVCCEAIYVITGKRLSGQLSPMRNSALINLCGLILILPLGLWQWQYFSVSTTPLSVWALLVVYALCASVVSTWLWLTGLKKVPASRAGVFTIGLPLAAAAVGIFVLNEPVTWWHAIALACSVFAIYLASSERG